MRVCIVGDYYSGTGPANVTKKYIENLPASDTAYIRARNKIIRLFELFTKIPKSDVVLLSGHSKQNLYAIKIAKKKNIPVVFLMHGCVEHENSINGVIDESMNLVERATMDGSDLILAVSWQFEKWLKENYKEYANRIGCLINGVDYDIIASANEAVIKDSNTIISIGGGMPRKRIVNICKAIEIINKKGNNLRLIVAGDKGLDTDIINSYSFVDNKGMLSFNQMMVELQKAKVFVQNSCFETFGLAPVEALMCGCDLLLSKECGVLSLFSDNICEDDLINNTDDCDEIAVKIEALLQGGNNDRLTKALDKESTSWEYRSAQLLNILKKISGKI